MCQCCQWPLFENKFSIKRHFFNESFQTSGISLWKLSNEWPLFDKSFQISGLCLTKVFKYVVFVWKKFSIFFKNIFFPQGCDCDPTAENPDRFCFHKIIFDFMQFMAMAIPWQYHWLYSGNIMGIITCSRWHWSKV